MNFDFFNYGLNYLNVATASWMSCDQILALQKYRLKKIVNYATENSLFYKKIYKNLDLSSINLSEFPIVKKHELMDQFDSWVCDPEINIVDLKKFIADTSNIGKLFLNRYLVWESSGSTGDPAIFLQDDKAVEVYDSLESFRKSFSEKMLHIIDPFWINERIAFIGSVGHFASNISFERLMKIHPLGDISLRRISITKPLDEIVKELQDFSPTIIATYPTAAFLLAELAPKSIELRELWTGGEKLTKNMRARIEKVFNTKIRNSYGASEFLPIAWECEFERLHINSDWVILEAVDENYQEVKNGNFSHTSLLTNLANFTQPLIRYELGDSICFHEQRCRCGSSFPSLDILGRVDDIVRLKNDQGKLIGILPLAITTVLEENAQTFHFQLIQKSHMHLVLSLPIQSKVSSREGGRCLEVLRHFLESQGINKVKIEVKYSSQSILGKTGKLKRIMIE